MNIRVGSLAQQLELKDSSQGPSPDSRIASANHHPETMANPSVHPTTAGSSKAPEKDAIHHIANMAGAVRQPIDLASLERYIENNVPEIKTPIDIKQVGFSPTFLPPSLSNRG